MRDDASSGDAMTHSDAAADASADAGGDAATCEPTSLGQCTSICEIWHECVTPDPACTFNQGWCGARALERSDASLQAVYDCMMSHVVIQPPNTTVDCVAVPTCWDSVHMCL
jgi:hypothetical protein